MLANLPTNDLINQLKIIREEQGLTIKNIYDMLEANNCHVSINSIKKVFAEGSENEHFRVHDTLQPIARVLLGIYGEDIGDSGIGALRAEMQMKDELITKLKQENSALNYDARRRIDYLKKQIDLKDEHIDKLMCRVDVLISQLDKLLDRCENCTARPKQDDQS